MGSAPKLDLLQDLSLNSRSELFQVNHDIRAAFAQDSGIPGSGQSGAHRLKNPWLRNQSVQRSVQVEQGRLLLRTAKPWPPVA